LEKNYSPKDAYSNTKLMNVLFSNELGRRLKNDGVITSSLHPGVISTGLHRTLENPVLSYLYEKILPFILKDTEHGAQTTIAGAISKKFEGKTSIYLAECDIQEQIPASLDVDVAKKLWEVSEKLVCLTRSN